MIGLRYLLRFAEDVGAIDRQQREALWERGEAAFRAVAEQQGEHQRAADPVARFPEMLAAILSSGRGHVAGPDGKEPDAPPSPEAWGWEAREFRTGLGDAASPTTAAGSKIGWVAGTSCTSTPTAPTPRCRNWPATRGRPTPSPSRPSTAGSRRRGCWSGPTADRTTYPVTLEGVRRRVLVLSTVPPPGETGTTGTTGTGPGERRRKLSRFRVPVSRRPPETGTGNRDEIPGETGLRPGCPGCPGFWAGEGVGGTARGGMRLWPADDVEVFTP